MIQFYTRRQFYSHSSIQYSSIKILDIVLSFSMFGSKDILESYWVICCKYSTSSFWHLLKTLSISVLVYGSAVSSHSWVYPERLGEGFSRGHSRTFTKLLLSYS